MGQTMILTCDLHSSDVEAVDTVRFGVGTASYELELCEKHLKEFNDKVTPFMDEARRDSRNGRAIPGSRKAATASPRKGRGRKAPARTTDLAEVREWARASGYEVSGRGRLSRAVVEAYESQR